MNALERGLAILAALRKAPEPPAFGTLRETLQVPPASFARTLADLVRLGYVEKTDDGRYRLGLACMGLAGAARQGRPLLRAAGDALDRIVADTQEAAELVEYHGGQFIMLDRRQSPRAVVLRARIGSGFTTNSSNAIGRLGMAFGGEGTGRVSAAQAAAIRQSGFDEQIQNNGEAYRASAAIFDEVGDCIGCLVVAAPAFRADESNTSRWRSLLLDQASAISRRLGHLPAAEEITA